MQSTLNFWSTFLDISRPTTAGYIPHRGLELRDVETTSASQLQAGPEEQFLESCDIFK
jgi:hypothetical protein